MSDASGGPIVKHPTRRTPIASWDLPAALLLLGLGAWLLLANSFLAYPLSNQGNAHQMAEYGAAIVIGICGIGLLSNRGSRLAAGLCVLVGVGLFAMGASHGPTTDTIRLNDMITGFLVVVTAGLIFGMPNPYREIRAQQINDLYAPKPRPALEAGLNGAGPSGSGSDGSEPVYTPQERARTAAGLAVGVGAAALVVRRLSRRDKDGDTS